MKKTFCPRGCRFVEFLGPLDLRVFYVDSKCVTAERDELLLYHREEEEVCHILRIFVAAPPPRGGGIQRTKIEIY
jgi:hypothetical protein